MAYFSQGIRDSTTHLGIVPTTLILPLFSPSYVNFGVTGMAAINKGGYLVLNEFEVSYITTPSPTRLLQGGVCVTFGIGVERDSLVTRFPVGAALDDESQRSENSD